MVRDTARRHSVPKAVSVVVGICVAAGLSLAAPVDAASPSTGAARIIARFHKKPARDARAHQATRRSVKTHRTH